MHPHWAVLAIVFFSAANPPFCILLCDTKLKDLQSTFFLWKLSVCQILAIGVQGEDQESGWIKRTNAGLPVSTQNALGWLKEDLGGTFFFFSCFHLEVKTTLPMLHANGGQVYCSNYWLWLNHRPGYFSLPSSIRHPLLGPETLLAQDEHVLGFFCSFLILALCWH